MELAEAVRQLAKQQNDGTYPSNVLFGTIDSVNPLALKIDKYSYPKDFLAVSERLTRHEYDFEITIDGVTKTAKVNIDNSLKKGDKVIVSRQQGGQKFVILDRIGG